MTDFEALYQKYAQDVFRFALFLSGNRADAEDIASETFVRAWNASDGIRQSTVKGYLLVIARNCYLQGLRRSRRNLSLEDDFADRRQAPDNSAEQRAELAHVMRDLQQLPEVDRTALLMSAAEEMSYEQIAETLGLSLGAVKTRIHRARLKLEQARKNRR
ncbi:MAG TPA: RNA polymerase sigma factor [Terriglobales bacterium]|nr:RNA polymerase sigma factor [Terriglobales bacterium]